MSSDTKMANVLSLTKGDFFGEIALLSDKPRQASVMAKGKVTCMVISRGAFTRLCGNLTDILKRNMDTYKTVEDLADVQAVTDGVAGMGRAPSGDDDDDEPDVEPDPIPMAARRFSTQVRRSNVFVEPIQIEANWTPPEYPKEDSDRRRLASLLPKTSLLGKLDDQTINTVIEALDKKEYGPGDAIITQGEDGDFFYLLDQGDCDVFKTTDGEEKKVFEYATGGSFGELALLHGEPRAATVKARTAVKAWALDRDTFRKIMVTSGTASIQKISDFLDKVSLLAELQHFERFKIAEAMQMRTFADGDLIIKEGDDGNEFFIIQEGNVECFKNVSKP